MIKHPLLRRIVHGDRRWSRAGFDELAHAPGHDIYLRNSVAYFCFAFSFGGQADIHKVARKLMTANIAEAGVVAGRQVEMAPRYRKLQKTRQDALKMAALASRIDSGDATLLSLLRQYPRLALKVMPGYMRAVTRGSRSETDVQPVPEDGSWARDTSRDMLKVVEDIDKSMEHAQVSGGLRAAVDDDLFNPHYLETEPFLRLELQGLTLKVGTSAEDAFEDPCPVWLTVHTSEPSC